MKLVRRSLTLGTVSIPMIVVLGGLLLTLSVLGMVVISVWILSPWFGSGSYSVVERIGAARWFLGCGSLAVPLGAVFLAGLQLFLSQRKPKLEAWLYSPHTLEHGNRLVVTFDHARPFPFHVHLKNYGAVPATNVVLTLEIHRSISVGPRGPSRWPVETRLDESSPYHDLWNVSERRTDLLRRDLLRFEGGADFAMAGDDRKTIGAFNLHLTNGAHDRPATLVAMCTIACREVPTEDYEFFFEINP